MPNEARTNLSSAPDQQMKILLVTHYYGQHGGGVERVADKLVDEIGATNYFHFTWAASDTDATIDKDYLTALPMRATNFIEKLMGIPWPIWGPKSLRRLKAEIAKADLVWIHDTLYLGNILAFRWAKKLKKSIVITQHIGPIPYRNVFLRLLMKGAERVFTFRMLKGATQTTFISDRVAEYFYQRISFTRSIQIIPNGVDSRLYHPPMREKRVWLRQQFALRDDQPVMLFVGRLVEKKGLAVIRLLAKLLPEWRFWIAGKGPIKPETWHQPNIHVFRDRFGENLAELYQAADLLLLPSYGEGFPLVIQEAMSCGLPVVCSAETAAGSHVAEPYLAKAKVFPTSPSRTSELWGVALRAIAPQLPRLDANEDLSTFAASSWNWPVIAGAYVEIFKAFNRSKP